MTGYNYRIEYADFQTDSVKGVAVQVSNDSYLIVINSALSEEGRKEALAHELYHIEHHHIDKDGSVGQIECEAHKKATAGGKLA